MYKRQALTLAFEVQPTQVTLRRWPAEYVGRTQEGEDQAETLEAENGTVLLPGDGDCVYEICACLLYTSISGMRLRDYLRGRRLAFALKEVRDSEKSLLDRACRVSASLSCCRIHRSISSTMLWICRSH